MVRVSLARGGELRAETDGKSRLVCRDPRPAQASATAEHLRQFVDEIRHGRISSGPGEQAVELLRIVRAGYESARTQQTIRLR